MKCRKPSLTTFSLDLACIVLLMFAGAAFARESTVYIFPSTGLQGAIPNASVIADSSGNLYGTTTSGGAFGNGAVFELVRPVPPSTQWTETVLYSFIGSTDGAEPAAGVIFDSVGNLYGTTYQGGTVNSQCSAGCGTVFELSPPATQGDPWTETVLHSFTGGGAGIASDGAQSVAGLIFDQKGNLYGTTAGGGRKNVGTAFVLTPPATSGGPWTESVIYSFDADQYPRGTLIFDAKGNLFGTTYADNTQDNGVAFRLAPPAVVGGAWSYKVLYAFGGGTTDGANPGFGLTLRRGVFYGTTDGGGQFGSGTVFQLVPPAVAGGAWSDIVLHSFGSIANDGDFVSSRAIFDPSGNIYGTTLFGGGSGTNICGNGGCGTVFQLTPPSSVGGTWTETILHVFTGRKDGGEPYGAVVFGKNGVLYGTAEQGGSGSPGVGTVFRVIP